MNRTSNGIGPVDRRGRGLLAGSASASVIVLVGLPLAAVLVFGGLYHAVIAVLTLGLLTGVSIGASWRLVAAPTPRDWPNVE